jgi:hypothetical protein
LHIMAVTGVPKFLYAPEPIASSVQLPSTTKE